MSLKRHHWPWAIFTLLAGAAAVVLYVAALVPDMLPFELPLPAFLTKGFPQGLKFGRTPLGLLFGCASFAIFFFAVLYAIRRWKPAWRVGSVEAWFRAHIWLTLLTVPLVLLHANFAAADAMSRWLLGLYAFVMATGFCGLAFRYFLPKLMKEEWKPGIFCDQIPQLKQRLREAAGLMRQRLQSAPGLSEGERPVTRLRQALDEEILPYLAGEGGGNFKVGTRHSSDEYFRELKTGLPSEWQGRADEMQGWCSERRQLDLQTKMHRWMRRWLWLHTPAWCALLVVAAWHAVRTTVVF